MLLGTGIFLNVMDEAGTQELICTCSRFCRSNVKHEINCAGFVRGQELQAPLPSIP